MIKLDKYDIDILRILSERGRITKSELAESVNLSISPVWERVRRLEQLGLIEGYRAVINWDEIAPGHQVLVEVSLSRHRSADMQAFEDYVRSVNEIVFCYATGGGIDYMMCIRAKTIADYQVLIDHLLEADLGIEKYFTYIVTKVIKRAELSANKYLLENFFERPR